MKTEYINILNDDFKIKEKSVVALGVFDGVHIAHTKLIKKCMEEAVNREILSVVFTFDKSPKKNAGVITSNSQKEKYIEELKPDFLVFQKMDEDFMSLSPDEFICLLKEKLNAETVVAGENFTFGKNKSGNSDILKSLGEKYGFEVLIESLLKDDREIVSSTLIRDLLSKGDVERVNKYLGRQYEITGIVEEGNKIGRTIDFPTVNIYPDEKMLLPKYGVYKTTVVFEGKEYKAITNVGMKPTVEKNRLSVESHILSLNQDLYGREISVKFKEFIRPETKFKTIEELKNQIAKDIEKINED